MTKIEAIRQVILDNGGVANWQMIYNDIEKYYPNAKNSSAWQEGIRGVLYRDIRKGGLKKVDIGMFAFNDFDEKNALIINREENIITDKEYVVKIRTMQTKFREKLIEEVKSCPITEVTFKHLLIASHIKPWNLSNNSERIDAKNGFLFTPTYDKLFDKGYISFDCNKRMMISPKLSNELVSQLKLSDVIIDKLPIKGREEYLEFHTKNIFIR